MRHVINKSFLFFILALLSSTISFSEDTFTPTKEFHDVFLRFVNSEEENDSNEIDALNRLNPRHFVEAAHFLHYLLVDERYKQTNLSIDCIVDLLGWLNNYPAYEAILYIALYYPTVPEIVAPALADFPKSFVFFPAYNQILKRKDISDDLRKVIKTNIYFTGRISTRYSLYDKLKEKSFAIKNKEYSANLSAEFDKIFWQDIDEKVNMVLPIFMKKELWLKRLRGSIQGVGFNLLPQKDFSLPWGDAFFEKIKKEL